MYLCLPKDLQTPGIPWLYTESEKVKSIAKSEVFVLTVSWGRKTSQTRYKTRDGREQMVSTEILLSWS